MKRIRTVITSLVRFKYHKTVGFSTLSILIATLTGCTQLDTTRTGYLSDYSQLQKQDARTSLLRPRVIESGGSGLEAFDDIDSFLIEPVAWKAGEVAPGSFEESCQLNLSTKLRQALIDELGTVRKVVEFPGPHTATVRAAVTHVAFARPILNTALTVVAVPLFNGGGVVEAEVKAPDGRQIAVVVAALPGRATDVLGFFTFQGHAETAMRRSAAQLKTILTQTPNKNIGSDVRTKPDRVGVDEVDTSIRPVEFLPTSRSNR